jgi:hypothetical protein
MFNKTVRHTLSALMVFTLCSCAAEQQQQMLGALGGAAAGAGIAALAGGDGGTIAAAAAGGALVGWGAVRLAQYQSQRIDDARPDAVAFGYQPSQGTVVKLRSAAAAPQQVNAGQRVNFEMDYAVLSGQPNALIPVREMWELSKDGKVVSTMPAQVQQRQPGGWHSQGGIDIPAGAEKGTYVVKSRVEADTSYDERISAFVVM